MSGRAYLHTNAFRRAILITLVFLLPLKQKLIVAQPIAVDSLLKMGMQANANKNPELAIQYLKQAIGLDSNSINRSKANCFLEMSTSYAAMGDYDKAYAAYANYILIKDSLFSIEKNLTVNNLENDYATLQKDKEITEKQILLTEQKELSRRKSTWITAISVGGLFIFMLCIISYRNYRNKQVIYQKILDRELKDQEISLLNANRNGEEIERENIANQLQINISHNLSSIQSKFQKLKEEFPALNRSADFKNTLRILKDAQIGLQESVHFLNPPQFIKNGLIETIQSFVNNIRTTENFEINLIISGEVLDLPIQTEVAIYRIVQELVQNIIKHAEASQAEINLAFTPFSLNLSVIDNGKGFDIKQIKEGMGLTNIQERVALLNGTINILQQHGTSVFIDFPKSGLTSVKNNTA